MGNGRQANKTRVCGGRRNRINDEPAPRPNLTPEQRLQMQLVQTAAVLQSIRAPPNVQIPNGTTCTMVNSERSGSGRAPQAAARGAGRLRQHLSSPTPVIQNSEQGDDSIVVDLTIDDIIADTSVPQVLSSLSTSASSNISTPPQSLQKGKRPLRGTAPTKSGATGSKKSRINVPTETATTSKANDTKKRGPVVQVVDVQIVKPAVHAGPSHQNAVPQRKANRDSARSSKKEDNNEFVLPMFSQETHRETFVAAAEAVRGWKAEVARNERDVADANELIERRHAEAEIHRRELQLCRNDIEAALERTRLRKERIRVLNGRIQAFLDVCRN